MLLPPALGRYWLCQFLLLGLWFSLLRCNLAPGASKNQASQANLISPLVGTRKRQLMGMCQPKTHVSDLMLGAQINDAKHSPESGLLNPVFAGGIVP